MDYQQFDLTLDLIVKQQLKNVTDMSFQINELFYFVDKRQHDNNYTRVSERVGRRSI